MGFSAHRELVQGPVPVEDGVVEVLFDPSDDDDETPKKKAPFPHLQRHPFAGSRQNS